MKVFLEIIPDNKIVQFCVPGALSGPQVLYLVLYKWRLVENTVQLLVRKDLACALVREL